MLLSHGLVGGGAERARTYRKNLGDDGPVGGTGNPSCGRERLSRVFRGRSRPWSVCCTAAGSGAALKCDRCMWEIRAGGWSLSLDPYATSHTSWAGYPDFAKPRVETLQNPGVREEKTHEGMRR